MKYYISAIIHTNDFDGRTSREAFFYFMGIHACFFLLTSWLDGLIETAPLISLLYQIAICIPFMAICVRRMHDAGKSGWHALLPFYGLYCLCSKGSSLPHLNGERIETEETPLLSRIA